MTFVEEIKQSKAFKLTASYLGICFIALQVLDPLSERDIIDESLFKILVYILVAGIPVPLLIGIFSDRNRVKLLNKKPNLNVLVSILAPPKRSVNGRAGLDKIFDAQKGEVDKNKRKALVHKFEKTALENAWVLPVTYTDRVIALNSKVKGYVIANSHILNNTWRGVYLD